MYSCGDICSFSPYVSSPSLGKRRRKVQWPIHVSWLVEAWRVEGGCIICCHIHMYSKSTVFNFVLFCYVFWYICTYMYKWNCRCNNTTYTLYDGPNVMKRGLFTWSVCTMIQFIIIIILHYNHSTIMQYLYICMAIRRAIYTTNTVCCSQINIVNLTITAATINSQSITINL